MKRADEAVGKPMDRVDGRLKVTGGAQYSADMPVNNIAYGFLITSTISSGRIRRMDTSEAEKVPGVLAILTPFHVAKMEKGSIKVQSSSQQSGGPNAGGDSGKSGAAGGTAQQQSSSQSEQASQPGQQGGSQGQQSGQGGQQIVPGGQGAQQARRPTDRRIHLLQEDDVFYNGQPIGVVVADTLDRAIYAASLVRVSYQKSTPMTSMTGEMHRAYKPAVAGGRQDMPDSLQGDLEAGRQAAASIVENTYITPVETHNAMEPHATVAVWEGDHLTLFDATQGIFGNRKRVADLFEIPVENVRVITHFVGGGFGSKGPVWSHVVLTAMAARQVGRPVKLTLSRHQMFGPTGFRGETIQHVKLGARQDGLLSLVEHNGIVQTSVFDEFIEPVGTTARMLYACPNIGTTHRAVRLNMGTPSFTRAPGEAPGVYALESAMDELAYKLRVDPIEVRLRNYAEVEPESGKPFSSKSLRECYRVGAERFGWSKRTPEPRSMRDRNMLIGYGMATATYPTNRSAASARARIMADGTAVVQSGSQDIGTGTYTVMTQVAADAIGLPPERIQFQLGDTDLPPTPASGGSQTAASVGSAVFLAGHALRSKLIQLAVSDRQSPLYGASESEVTARNGGIYLKNDSMRGEDYTALLARHNLPQMEARADAAPGDEKNKYAMHSFGAQFAEVRVDPDLGILRVSRYVGVFAAGKILNAKTARNQFMGGITWGISMALMENTLTDPHTGRIMNADLAEYHVPVHADIPDLDVTFLDEVDPYVNPVGVKGIGEIGIVGAPAAIANAVYHATGKRIRDLPITLDKLL
jgi:xanthine dehydrogenase YagR molybdenum-binding subunit